MEEETEERSKGGKEKRRWNWEADEEGVERQIEGDSDG